MKKGYIEGYYGRLFSKEEREMVVNHMGNLKMDFISTDLKKILTTDLIGRNHTQRNRVMN